MAIIIAAIAPIANSGKIQIQAWILNLVSAKMPRPTALEMVWPRFLPPLLANPSRNRSSIRVQGLEPSDLRHLDAAVGWLGLGCTEDARAELDLISTARQQHPAVLDARWTLCAQEKRWAEALEIARAELAARPDDCPGWLHRAYALRRVPDGGLPQAWDAILKMALADDDLQPLWTEIREW